MKRLLACAAICAFGVLSAHADPDAAGVWRTISDVNGEPEGLVEITEINGEISGAIVGSLIEGDDPDRVCEKCPGDKRGQKLLGMEILGGLSQDRKKSNVYRGGWVIDPNNGSKYKAKVTISPDGRTLQLRGFIGIEAMGRTQIWERHDQD